MKQLSPNLVTSRSYIDRVRELIRVGKSKPCADCGGTFDPICMDFDHRPGETKSFGVSTAIGNGIGIRKGRGGVTKAMRLGKSRIQIVADEIAKCDVVCACCHRLRTKNRGQYHHGKGFQQNQLVEDGIQLALTNLFQSTAEAAVDGGIDTDAVQ